MVFIESKGRIFEAPERIAEDEGEEYGLYLLIHKDELLRRMKDEIEECSSLEEVKDVVIRYEEINDAIDELSNGEGVLTKNGRYHSTIELHPMWWHDTDNNEYVVAVME